MIAILERWRLRAGTEETFRRNWAVLAAANHRAHGTFAARLHRADNGTLFAYSVWPDEQQRMLASRRPSVAPVAAAEMRRCIVEHFEVVPLEIVEELPTT